jgi:hypothetical protein
VSRDASAPQLCSPITTRFGSAEPEQPRGDRLERERARQSQGLDGRSCDDELTALTVDVAEPRIGDDHAFQA